MEGPIQVWGFPDGHPHRVGRSIQVWGVPDGHPHRVGRSIQVWGFLDSHPSGIWLDHHRMFASNNTSHNETIAHKMCVNRVVHTAHLPRSDPTLKTRRCGINCANRLILHTMCGMVPPEHHHHETNMTWGLGLHNLHPTPHVPVRSHCGMNLNQLGVSHTTLSGQTGWEGLTAQQRLGSHISHASLLQSRRW